MRIAYARIFQETCPFSPLPTTKDDFLATHFVTGEALASACRLTGNEVPGMLRNAELSGFVEAVNEANLTSRWTGRPHIEAIPVMSAGVVPRGALTPETFDWLKTELLERLSAVGPVDGFYLCLHGSMQVQDLDGSPEAELVRLARSVVGQVPISISLDLHAHVTPDLMKAADIVCTYRTVPHRDFFLIGRRAGRLLIDTVRGTIRPTTAWRKLPVAFGGGLMIDFAKPLRSVFRYMKELEHKGGALFAGLCTVHPFTNARDIGWVVHVITDGDAAAAERMVEELAERAWQAAQVPVPKFHPPEVALQLARDSVWARRTGVVSIVDTADVVSAGAPGGNTWLLKQLVDHPQDLVVYLTIHDPAAVARLGEVPRGSRTEITVRGTPGLLDNPEVVCRGKVLGHYDTSTSGRAVVLDLEPVKVVLTEKPPMTIFPRLYREVQLSPWKADVVVQKAFFHYRWFFGLYNRRNIAMETKGATDLRNLGRVRRSVPLIPFEPIADWRPHDRTLRGLATSEPAVGRAASGPLLEGVRQSSSR